MLSLLLLLRITQICCDDPPVTVIGQCSHLACGNSRRERPFTVLICDFLLAIINERLVETRNEKSLAFIIPRNGRGGGVLPYISYIGMCRPIGWRFGLEKGLNLENRRRTPIKNSQEYPPDIIYNLDCNRN